MGPETHHMSSVTPTDRPASNMSIYSDPIASEHQRSLSPTELSESNEPHYHAVNAEIQTVGTDQELKDPTNPVFKQNESISSPFAIPGAVPNPVRSQIARTDVKGKLLRLKTTPDALGSRSTFPHTAHPGTSVPMLPLSPGPESAKVTGTAADMHARILALQRSRSKKARGDGDSNSSNSANPLRSSLSPESGPNPASVSTPILGSTSSSDSQPAPLSANPESKKSNKPHPGPLSLSLADSGPFSAPGSDTPRGSIISPTAVQMAASGAPFARSNSFRTRQRSSLSARRGMNLNDSSSPSLNLNLKNLQIKPKTPASTGLVNANATPSPSNPSTGLKSSGNTSTDDQSSRKGLFSDYRKYIDIETGALNFAGKACVHAQGIEFSSGEKFNISLDTLQFISELGAGNYGTVQKVLHTPNNVVMAVKEIRLELDESAFRQIIMELDVLHRCEMHNIIDFYGAFFIEGAVYICMEYMDGGSVNQIYSDGIPEKYLKYIVKSVVQGLRQLKEEFHIIHRDVKPTNILCSTTGEIKLCDFGVSGNLVASMAMTNIGCQSYMAPERINSGGANPAVSMASNPRDAAFAYTVESDIWSLGLSIIEMATGEYPYDPESYGSIFSQLNAIVEDPAPKLDPSKYSPEACDFVARMLDKSPTKRPRYSQIAEHPWLQSPACTKEEMGEFVRERLEKVKDTKKQQQQKQKQQQQQQPE